MSSKQKKRNKIFYALLGLAIILLFTEGLAIKYAGGRESAGEEHHISDDEAGPPNGLAMLKEIGAQPPYVQAPFIEGPFGQIFYVRLIMSWIVMGLLLVLAYFITRKFSVVPSRIQSLGEAILGFFDGLTKDTLGTSARRFFPFVTTLFLFIIISNWIGILPEFFHFIAFVAGIFVAPFDAGVSIVGGFMRWHVAIPDAHWLALLTRIPEVQEPTADLNTTLACGILVFLTVHFWAIRSKGIREYLKEYTKPFVFMVPLNIVGELAKIVSLSFRLFGNIMGGSIVILVITTLLLALPWIFIPFAIVIPVGLKFFLGLFIGAIQAFVFATLALTYTAVASSQE